LNLAPNKLPKRSAITEADSGWGFFLCTYKEIRAGRSGKLFQAHFLVGRHQYADNIAAGFCHQGLQQAIGRNAERFRGLQADARGIRVIVNAA
jgi:hypothetical protein